MRRGIHSKLMAALFAGTLLPLSGEAQVRIVEDGSHEELLS